MRNLVCIGVGGTGAACVEATLQLASLGLYRDCTLTAALVDADQAHPRIVRANEFARRYNEVRRIGDAPEGWRDGLFGTPVSSPNGAKRPSGYDDLFSLLGLHSPLPAAVARLFFAADETDRESHPFRNGYYGRTNAGVCFFSDATAKASILTPLHPVLQAGRVVIFGSNFGGTGAAGMLDLARAIRESQVLAAAPPEIAIVQLEPYLRPDATRAASSAVLINRPETFERRAAATYRFLEMLEQTGNLPFDLLYPLGVETPASFPADADWFKADSQDNPPLFLEYLAGLAAADFLERGPAHGGAGARKREAALAPFGKPLDRFRDLLFAATVSQAILTKYLLPLLEQARRRERLAGHPWIHDLLEESNLRLPALVDHFSRAEALLREVLLRFGVLAPSDLRKRDLTLRSFPARFLAQGENVDLAQAVTRGNPVELFDDYELHADGKLPVRALYRWILKAQTVPDAAPAGTVHPPERAHQLCQQEDQGNGQVLGLSRSTTDEFEEVPAEDHLIRRLAHANWHQPLNLPSREEWELPTVWATALAHRERLYGRSLSGAGLERVRYLQLGLLWQALMQEGDRSFAPLYAFDVESLPEILRDSIIRTCPLGKGYLQAVHASYRIIAIYEGQKMYAPTGDDHPPTEKVIGFFYPDTVAVPAAGLSAGQRDGLYDKGRYVAGLGFAAHLLATSCADWATVLARGNVPHAKEAGPDFTGWLKAFPEPARALAMSEHAPRPVIPGVSSWILNLYPGVKQ